MHDYCYSKTLEKAIPYHLTDLLTAVERHRLKSVINSRFALADVHQALSRLESGRQFGKVALEVG